MQILGFGRIVENIADVLVPARSGTSSASGSALKDALVPRDGFFALCTKRKMCEVLVSELRPSTSSSHGSLHLVEVSCSKAGCVEFHMDMGAPLPELMDANCGRFGLQSASVHFRLNAGDVTRLRFSARECGYVNCDVLCRCFYDPDLDDWV